MKNKKLILFLFILFVPNTLKYNTIYAYNILKENTNIEEEQQLEKDLENEDNEEQLSFSKKDKKILKTEIRRRKRYHKGLLSLYNKDFDTQYLDLITSNWLIINDLNKYYEKNFIENVS